jgi:hypothetical protein
MGYMGREPKEAKEVKAGKTISAATRETIGSAHEHVKSAADIPFALSTGVKRGRTRQTRGAQRSGRRIHGEIAGLIPA